jgi:hypothetical protein
MKQNTRMIQSLKKTKHLYLLLSLILLQQVSSKAQTTNKIDNLISKMTLEEKVGQMTNITIGTIATEIGDSYEQGWIISKRNWPCLFLTELAQNVRSNSEH